MNNNTPIKPTLDSTQTLVGADLHGWTGKPCPNCQGSGEGRGADGEWRKCTACAGTGDEYGLLLKTPDEWLKTEPYVGISILDPDGWDRTNFEASWAKPISSSEFDNRLSVSTARYPVSFFRKIIETNND